MQYCKTGALVALAFLLTLLSSCSTPEPDPRLEKITLHSEALDKDMAVQVRLPEGYWETDREYPVLYFLPDGGGGAATVMDNYQIGDWADELTEARKIEPMIIVSMNLDASFGINSSDTVERVETESGKSFHIGRYEDYIVQDVIPYIDSTYRTIKTRQGRWIGGYSLGGFAALHIAFRNPQLFSRVGGHSPSLFTGDFPDKTISDWLYPDETTREDRDPVYLAKNRDLSGLTVYLDTGETDVNTEGCAALYDVLKEREIPVEYNLFEGTHSRGYCNAYMGVYLIFYAGIEE